MGRTRGFCLWRRLLFCRFVGPREIPFGCFAPDPRDLSPPPQLQAILELNRESCRFQRCKTDETSRRSRSLVWIAKVTCNLREIETVRSHRLLDTRPAYHLAVVLTTLPHGLLGVVSRVKAGKNHNVNLGNAVDRVDRQVIRRYRLERADHRAGGCYSRRPWTWLLQSGRPRHWWKPYSQGPPSPHDQSRLGWRCRWRIRPLHFNGKSLSRRLVGLLDLDHLACRGTRARGSSTHRGRVDILPSGRSGQGI